MILRLVIKAIIVLNFGEQAPTYLFRLWLRMKLRIY